MNRLQIWNKNIVSNDLIYKLNLSNLHDLIKLNNVALKSTINTSISEPKDIIFGLIALELLTNQKAKIVRTKKSISAFKTRKFIPISSKITLRREKLYSYVDFLICIALPKWPQFKELDKNSLINTKNSLSLGLANLSIFPQLSKESEQFPKNIGISITFNCTSNESELLELLSQFQFPVKGS